MFNKKENESMNQILDFVNHFLKTEEDRFMKMYQHLHAYPEISGEEFETTKFIIKQLKSVGTNPRPLSSGRGVIVDINPDQGDVIILRFDIDALPVAEAEDSELPFRSRHPGKAHVCGHDGHAASGLALAEILEQIRKRGLLKGWVRIIFQPAEETGDGANEVIADGAVDIQANIRGIIGWHIMPGMPSGSVGLLGGPVNAGCDDWTLSMHGRQAHSARPHESIDLIQIKALIFNHLTTLLRLKIDSFEPWVFTPTQESQSKQQAVNVLNVMPAEISVGGTFRCYSETVSALAEELIRRYLGLLTLEFPSFFEWNLTWKRTPPLINDEGLIEQITKVAGQLNYKIVQMRRSPGSDDMAQFGPFGPIAYLFGGNGYGPGLHDQKFVLNWPTVLSMVRLIIMSINEIFGQ